MVAGGGDKEASVEVFRTYILCNSESLVIDLPVHDSRKLSPRFWRANAFLHLLVLFNTRYQPR